MISTSKRFLFVHVPKTAGNSIQSLLAPYADDRIVAEQPHQDGVERFNVVNDRFGTSKHATMTDYKRAIDAATFRSLYKFSVARNPWDRMISWYFSPNRAVTEFDRDDFIAFVRSRPTLRDHIVASSPADRLKGSLGVGRRPLTADLDALLRYESLNDDLAEVLETIGVPFEPLPVRNRSEREHYSVYYDDELRDLVGERFREEIEQLGYRFEPVQGAASC